MIALAPADAVRDEKDASRSSDRDDREADSEERRRDSDDDAAAASDEYDAMAESESYVVKSSNVVVRSVAPGAAPPNVCVARMSVVAGPGPAVIEMDGAAKEGAGGMLTDGIEMLGAEKEAPRPVEEHRPPRAVGQA